MENLSVRVVHSLREGNILADFFTNLVFDFADDFQSNCLEEVPVKGKAIINLDKKGTPNIRRTSKKE